MANLSFTAFAAAGALICAVACGSTDPSLIDGTPNGGAGDSSIAGGGSPSTAAAGTEGIQVGTDAGTGGAGADTCGGTTLDASPTQVNVLLVVDNSLSMASTPMGFGDTKWNGIRAALGTAIDATHGQVAFGLDLFPNSGRADKPLANGCELPASGAPSVAVASGATTNDAIKQALADNAPAGATPTAAALSRALDYFTRGDGARLTGRHYVLLATDGGPNCNADLSCAAEACTINMDGLCPAKTNCCDAKLDPAGPSKCLDDDATVGVVRALADAGVKTFVVGIPGTEAYQPTLDAVALAGQTPNPDAPPSYFAIDAADGVKTLSQVLTRITTGLITSCELTLSEDPPDYERINVEIDGKLVPEGSTDGWSLDMTKEPPTVVLEGATCAEVRKNGAQQLRITFGCPTEHIK